MNYSSIFMNGGSNRYPIPHMRKERLERSGILPDVVEVWKLPDELFENWEDEEGDIDTDNNFDGVIANLEVDEEEDEELYNKQPAESYEQQSNVKQGKQDKNEDDVLGSTRTSLFLLVLIKLLHFCCFLIHNEKTCGTLCSSYQQHNGSLSYQSWISDC
jgi:hypothetical protein